MPVSTFITSPRFQYSFMPLNRHQLTQKENCIFSGKALQLLFNHVNDFPPQPERAPIIQQFPAHL